MADEQSTTPPVSELAAQLASHIANKPLAPAAGSVPTTGQSDRPPRENRPPREARPPREGGERGERNDRGGNSDGQSRERKKQ